MKHAIILAGGSGTRFWPLSRRRRPKQTLRLMGGLSLLRQTFLRLEGLVGPGQVLVVTRRGQDEAVRQELPEVPPGRVIAEPIGRNTAASVALAIRLIGSADPGGVACVLPSDHHIPDAGAFRADLERAFAAAREHDTIVTLGVQPTFPATGYGYLRRGAPVGREAVRRLEAFIEKPDRETARRFLDEGACSWNSGIFVLPVEEGARALREHAPDVWREVARLVAPGGTLAPDRVIEEAYPRIRKVSFDRAVMERYPGGLVLDAGFAWHDLGSFGALADLLARDTEGNRGLGDFHLARSRDNVIYSDEGSLVVGLGVDNLIIIHTADVTLVCARERDQEIRELVEELERQQRERFL